jgi:hypothetical protein
MSVTERYSDNISFMEIQREQPNFIFNKDLMYDIKRKYNRMNLTSLERKKLIMEEYNKYKRPVMSNEELTKEFLKRINERDERNKRKAIKPNKNLKERVKEQVEILLMGDKIRNKKPYAILMTVITLALGGSYLKYLSEESRKKKKKK